MAAYKIAVSFRPLKETPLMIYRDYTIEAIDIKDAVKKVEMMIHNVFPKSSVAQLSVEEKEY
jgi:hypothetical protein